MTARGPLLLAALLATWPSAGAAQVLDEGVFSIRVDGREIGREEFSVRSGRGPDGGTAGTTITAVTRYPAISPRSTYTTVVERSLAGRFTVFQLEVDTPEGEERYLGAQDRGRITIHRFTPQGREAREFPGGESAQVLVDSVYAIHYILVDMATAEGAAVTTYLPRTSGRRRLSATLAPGETSQVHVSGDREVRITLDGNGRIQGITFPGSPLSVVRLRD